MLTILQGSDVHFGRPHDSEAEAHFIAEVERVNPDVVVLAGDFTQRAKVGEYQRARRFLSVFNDRPVVVTPGNHDVALYRIWERLGNPFRNYKRFVHPDLDHSVQVPGATFVSLNTASPRRAIVNGRLDEAQLDFAARVFHVAPSGDLRCLVLHHSLVAPPDGGGEPTVPGAKEKLARIRDMGVELVLGGHLHRGFAVRHEPDGVVLSHSGTATSSRGRRAERGGNSFSVVRVSDFEISVTRFLRKGDGAFEETRAEEFERRRLAGASGAETEPEMGR